jgi:hypothetical protein
MLSARRAIGALRYVALMSRSNRVRSAAQDPRQTAEDPKCLC